MGHVINPISLRLGLNIFWVSNWVSYYSRSNYSYLFGIDYQIFLIFEWFLYFALKRNVESIFFNVGTLREMISHYKIYKDSKQMHLVIYVYFEGFFKRKFSKNYKLDSAFSGDSNLSKGEPIISTSNKSLGFSLLDNNKIIRLNSLRTLNSKRKNKNNLWKLKSKLSILENKEINSLIKNTTLMKSNVESFKDFQDEKMKFLMNNSEVISNLNQEFLSKLNLLILRRLSFKRFNYLFLVLNKQFPRFSDLQNFFTVMRFYLFLEVFQRLNKNFVELSNILSKGFISFRHLKKITFVPISQEWISANLIFRYIATQLRYHRNFNFIIKLLITKFQQSETIKGFKIFCTGRFTRKERAMFLWIRHGKVPSNTYAAPIEYFASHYKSRYGVGGLKIWLYRN